MKKQTKYNLTADQKELENELTDKEKIFAYKYCECLNITNSAIYAGYSLKTACQIGQQLFRKLRVNKFIRSIMEEREKELKVTSTDVLREAVRLAFMDMKDFLQWDENGNIKFKKYENVDGKCINEITSVKTFNEEGEKVQTKLKLNNKDNALKLLFMHLGMLQEKLVLNPNEPKTLEIKFV